MSEKDVLKYIEDLINDNKDSGKKRIKQSILLKRIIAYLIDILIFYFSFYLIFVIIFNSITGIFSTSLSYSELNYYLEKNNQMHLASLTLFFGSMFIFLFYLVVFEYYNNKTLGEKCMHLIVKAKKPRVHQIIIRNLTKTFLMPFLLFDSISIFFTQKRQRLTEMLSKTYVEDETK